MDDSLPFPFYRLINIGWFPCLEIKQFSWLTNVHFMLFDRYEIHIQALLEFINGNFSFSILISTKICSEINTRIVYMKLLSNNKNPKQTQNTSNNANCPLTLSLCLTNNGNTKNNPFLIYLPPIFVRVSPWKFSFPNSNKMFLIIDQ